MAVLAATPAVDGVVLVVDALIDLGSPLWKGAPFTAVLLGPSDISDLSLPPPRDPVHFLSATPVTATEAAWVRLKGADAMRQAWQLRRRGRAGSQPPCSDNHIDCTEGRSASEARPDEVVFDASDEAERITPDIVDRHRNSRPAALLQPGGL